MLTMCTDVLDRTDEVPPPSPTRFAVLNRQGEPLAIFTDILIALPYQRGVEEAEDVIDPDSGVVLAKKHRVRKGGHFYSDLWGLDL